MSSSKLDLDDLYYNPKTGLSSFIKIFPIIKQKYPDISKKEVKDYLNNQEVNQVFKHRKVKHYFPLSSHEPFSRVQIDLMDVSNDSHWNKGFKFIFNLVDVYTKYAISFPLKSKNDNDVFNAFKSMMEEIQKIYNWLPVQVDSDMESSFMSRKFTSFCKNNNIHQNFSNIKLEYNSTSVVERFNQTLRLMIEKYKTAFQTNSWIDVLQDLLYNYNHSFHSNIKNTPIDAIEDNSNYDYQMEKQRNKAVKDFKSKNIENLNINDKVRLKIRKGVLDKKTGNIWSKTIHKIEKFSNGLYFVNDRLTGYKPYELLKIDAVDTFKPQDIQVEEQKEIKKKERLIKRRINKEGIDLINNNENLEKRKSKKLDTGFFVNEW